MDSKLVARNRRSLPRDPAEVRRLLASIVESSDDAIYGKDLDGIITSWNASAERVYGYTASEILGRSVALLIPPENGHELAEAIERLRNGEGVEHYETVRVAKDGRQIPVSLTISPIRDDSGTIIGASTIARDVSRLRVEEGRWRLLARIGEVLSGELDADNLLANLARLVVPDLADYCVTYRLEGKVIRRVGTAHADRTQEESVHRLMELGPPTLNDPGGAGAAMRRGEPLLDQRITEADLARVSHDSAEYLAILRDLQPVSSIVLPLGARGRTVGAIALVSTPRSRRIYEADDVTFATEVAHRAALALDNARLYQSTQAELSRREAAEDALRKRFEELRVLYQVTDAVSRASAMEEIYSEVLEGLQRALDADRAAILLFDPDRVLRFKAWRELSDEYRDAVEGHTPWSAETCNPLPTVVPDVQKEGELDEQLRSSILTEKIRAMAVFPLVFRSQLLGKFVLYFDAPRELSESELELARTIGGSVGFAISKMRDEQSVREARDSAERANEAKSQFLGIMSHELRTPLNAVLGYADLLLLETRGPLNEGQREQVERIKASAHHQLGLVNELLAYTRLEAGREEARLVPTDARRIVTDVAELIRPQVEAKGLRLRIHLPPGPVSFRTDPAKLRQIALNLAGNAAKYTEKGEISIHAGYAERRFSLSIVDTGPGIPPDMLEYIFEPFAQVDQSRTRQSGGTGLGLAIARQFAAMLGAEVSVESRIGEGSTFTLIVPDPD